jgi:hypothetical protein
MTTPLEKAAEAHHQGATTTNIITTYLKAAAEDKGLIGRVEDQAHTDAWSIYDEDVRAVLRALAEEASRGE